LAAYKEKNCKDFKEDLHDSATWYSDNETEYYERAKSVGVLATENEDVRSLIHYFERGGERYAEKRWNRTDG
jgi:hydroxylamine reductase